MQELVQWALEAAVTELLGRVRYQRRGCRAELLGMKLSSSSLSPAPPPAVVVLHPLRQVQQLLLSIRHLLQELCEPYLLAPQCPLLDPPVDLPRTQHPPGDDQELALDRRLRRENRILREEREIRTLPMKSVGLHGGPWGKRLLLRSGDRVQAVEAFGFVEQERADHRVARMCRVLGVSPSRRRP
jgi:hypothetical protein